MKSIRLFLAVFFLMVNFTLAGQNSYVDKIIGTWESEIKENQFEGYNLEKLGFKLDTTTKKEPDVIFYFQPNGILDYKQMGSNFKANYSIKDSILQLGNRLYIIQTLDDSMLVLRENNKFATQTYNYIRSDRTIVPIDQNQRVTENYPNGQLKVDGALNGGFRNGVWTEWFKNGSIQKVTYYNNDVPLMEIVFNEKGKIKSKTWYDWDSKKIMRE